MFRGCLLSVLRPEAAGKTVTVGRPVSPGGPSSPETAADSGWGEILLLHMVSSENLQLFPLGLRYFSDLLRGSGQPGPVMGKLCQCVSYSVLPSPPLVPRIDSNSRSVAQHSLHLPGLKVKHESDLGWEWTAQRRAGFCFARWGQELRNKCSPAQASAFSPQRRPFMEAPRSPGPALPRCLVRRKSLLNALLLGSLLNQPSI